MIRVISSPSSSTTGLLTLIFAISPALLSVSTQNSTSVLQRSGPAHPAQEYQRHPWGMPCVAEYAVAVCEVISH
jgi:hypothetical protein